MALFLKHHDYADDICLCSHGIMILGEMALDFEREANTVLSVTGQRTLPSCINKHRIEGVDQFVFLRENDFCRR